MQDLIKYLLDQIVTHHEAVQIESEQDGRRLTYHVKVHPEDLGAVIGRSGRTINAIRTLVSAAATQNDELGSCWVKLVDSDGRSKGGAGDEVDAEGEEDVVGEEADEIDADDEEPVDEDMEDGDEVVYDDDDDEDEAEREAQPSDRGA